MGHECASPIVSCDVSKLQLRPASLIVPELLAFYPFSSPQYTETSVAYHSYSVVHHPQGTKLDVTLMMSDQSHSLFQAHF